MVAAAEKISSVLERVIKENHLTHGFQEATIKMAWEGMVGKDVAKHTNPAFLKKGILMVGVDSSAWAYELSTHLKSLMLKKINQGLGREAVKDIHFRVGGLRKS
jgi:predicted nucleic acid-binding Zn ribbon protein